MYFQFSTARLDIRYRWYTNMIVLQLVVNETTFEVLYDALMTEPLVRGSGTSPPEAENLSAFGCPIEAANLLHILPTVESSSKRDCIGINLRNNLWQKWGGHHGYVHPVVDPVATPLVDLHSVVFALFSN